MVLRAAAESNQRGSVCVLNTRNTSDRQGLAGIEQAEASPGARMQFTFIS